MTLSPRSPRVAPEKPNPWRPGRGPLNAVAVGRVASDQHDAPLRRPPVLVPLPSLWPAGGESLRCERVGVSALSPPHLPVTACLHLSASSLLRSLQLIARLDALVARYKAGDESVLGKLVKLKNQMVQELAEQEAEGSNQTGDKDRL